MTNIDHLPIGLIREIRETALAIKQCLDRGCLWYREINPEIGDWTFQESLEFQAIVGVKRSFPDLDSTEANRLGIELVAGVIEDDHHGFLT